jgi:hypothetical protein
MSRVRDLTGLGIDRLYAYLYTTFCIFMQRLVRTLHHLCIGP